MALKISHILSTYTYEIVKHEINIHYQTLNQL